MGVPSISDLFPVVIEVRQGCVLAPTLFSACRDWILGRMSERSSCGTSFGNVKIISDRDFTDDAVIFAEILDLLLGALEVLIEESDPLGLWVSWVKTKIQAFNYILDAAILSVPVYVEDVEVRERLTYLGSDIHVFAGCEPEVNRRLGRAWGVMDSLDHGMWCCVSTCARGRKSESSGPWCFQSCSMDARFGL